MIRSSADSRGTGYPSKVRALGRHDLILGFAEHDCSVRLGLNGVKLYICSYSRETFFQNMVLKSLLEYFKFEETYWS